MVSDAPVRTTRLTAREVLVLRMVAEGMTNRQIGRQLHTSETAMTTCLYRLRRKLGARNRAHVVAIGYQKGLLGQPSG